MLLAAMVVIGNGLVVSAAHAQSQGTDPAAGSAADRFRLPSATDLAADAARMVIDDPTELPDTIDLQPIADAAVDAWDPLLPEEWEVGALAKTMSGEDAAFRFVRDSIRFDAYRGLLRGAQGTLSARAGNAFDRASLLRALLDAQGATSRFAFGTLGLDTATALVERSYEEPVTPLLGGSVSPFSDALETAVGTRARRDHALLIQSLGDRIADLATDADDAAVADVMSHAWVQVQQPDGSWLDLDPSLPGAEPGDTLTALASTADAVPQAEVQTVTLRVIAEALSSGTLQKTPVLDAALAAWEAGDQRISLVFAPAVAAGGGLLNSGGLFGGGGGPGAWAPILLVDHKAFSGDPIVFSGQVGGGLLGGSTQLDLASLALEITTSIPGQDPRTSTHVIVDRLTPQERATGTVSAADLAPVAVDGDTPTVFRSIVHAMVSTGGSDPRLFVRDRAYALAMAAWEANGGDLDTVYASEALAPAFIADQSMVVAAEQRFLPAIDGSGVRAYVATPRIYLADRAVASTDPGRVSLVTDIVSDDIRVLAGGDDRLAAADRLWYGSLVGAFETQYGLANASGLEPEGRRVEGVSLAMTRPLSVLTGSDEVLPRASDEHLATLLTDGGLAIVPGDISTATAWWEVAADGTTRSVLAPTLGGVGGVGGPRTPGGPRGPSIKPPSPPDKPRNWKNPFEDDLFERKPPTDRKDKDKSGGNEYLITNKQVAMKTLKITPAMAAVGVGVVVLVLWAILS